MESALAWIGQIASWFGQWIPRRPTLDTTEGAIKYEGFILPRKWRVKCGGFDGDLRVHVCGPGMHWWWPATSKWEPYPTARQTDRLESQVMESKDNKTFLVSGTLTYEVFDLGLLVPKTHSPTRNTLEIAMTAMHDVCCEMDWHVLQEEQRKGTIKTKLGTAAKKELAEYGVRVIRLRLNTLARCRVLKVAQSVSNEENV